ncbi:FKBP-type peptidyl-prolyl cis-trans isomerase N-terminal domain-containing protein [Rubritalea sp.]|uniref:FKBP-type peptidyl-prolyl cis-trans isomerase N-terminal domain-containing protein n=1 Tax=Rubritalea sp. TaxID=2109375 RepID=UPI003EF86D6F
MKKQLTIAALGLAFSASSFAQDKAAEAGTPELSAETVRTDSSYFFGYQSAAQLANAGLVASDFDKDSFYEGFISGLTNEEPKVSQDEITAVMQALQVKIQERDKKLGEENLKKEEAFLAENKKKEGVITTDSGLQYIILDKGGDKKYEAPADAPNGVDMQSEFTVNYKGTLIDGTEFDASPEGEPADLTLQVVPGFGEALKTMPIGAKWKLFIPSKLGYGERRMGPVLAPNSTLIFELELKDIGKREMPQGGMPFQLPAGAMPQGHPGQ